MNDKKKTAPAQTPEQTTTPENVPFDRSVCFTCFGDYVDTLKMIAAQQGPETAYAAFEILADFCLYGIEPDPERNPWGLVWPIVERRARLSINNRRRGFGTPDKELADRVREYAAENPKATQQQTAEAVGCHRHTVSKILCRDAALSDTSPSRDIPPCHDNGSSSVHGSMTPLLVNHPKDDLHFSPAVNVQEGVEQA